VVERLENASPDPGQGRSLSPPLVKACLQGRQVSRHRLAVGELGGAIGPFGVQEIEQGQGAAPVGVFADIAAPLRHIEIAGFQ